VVPQASKLTRRTTGLEESAFRELASTFRGELIRTGDDRYESARRIWNGMIDKRPALIARCTGVADVVTAVDFARENDLLVAVRGGGPKVAERLAPRRGSPGAISTARRSSSGWPRREARSRPRVSPASRSAAASGGSGASTR
jgi:hypothetical protein